MTKGYLKHFVLVVLLLLASLCHSKEAVSISGTAKISLLEYSSLYLDDSNLTLDTILTKGLLRPFHKPYINIGMKPQTVWISFLLQNPAKHDISKLLILTSPMLEHITLYQAESSSPPQTKGRTVAKKDRSTLFYHYTIRLKAGTSQRYYLKVFSRYTPVDFSVVLQDEKAYMREDTLQQLTAALLIGMILALMLYNFLISLHTHSKSYFYYSMYLLMLIWHQMTYLGFTQLYMPFGFNSIDISASNLKGALLILFSALFSMHFLKIKTMPILHIFYMVFIGITFLNLLFSLLLGIPHMRVIAIISIFYVVFVLIAGILSYRRGHKQARLFILGFSLLFLSYLMLVSNALGLTSFMHTHRNILIWSTAIDALILSLAFADRYVLLQKEKAVADQCILDEARNRERIIHKKVVQQTRQLNQALETKEILIQEIHHRVKNNLQVILSMVRLQRDMLTDTQIRAQYTTLENRISTISRTYDVLIVKTDLKKIDMKEYIEALLNDIKHTYQPVSDTIKVYTTVHATIPLGVSVYIGLIINELVSNAYKHAFDAGTGTIKVSLSKQQKQYVLSIEDSGKGYTPTQNNHNLGLKLIHTLIYQQLKGTLEKETKDHTKYTIRFCI